jgi:hypothetical protein
MRRKSIFDLVQGGLFLFATVFHFIFPSVAGNSLPQGIIIAISFLVVYGVIWLMRSKIEKSENIIELQEETNCFYDYFTSFYNKPGKLSIFCSDLDWMRYKSYDLVQIICKKGNNCKVYLRNDTINSDIENTLNESNVRIFFNHNLQTRHRFSLLEDNNTDFLIISEKKDGNSDNKIVVKKEDNYKNPYIITVVKDLLLSIEKENE